MTVLLNKLTKASNIQHTNESGRILKREALVNLADNMVKQLGVKSFCQSISGSTSLLWFQWYSAESTQQERNKNGTLSKSWITRNCVTCNAVDEIKCTFKTISIWIKEVHATCFCASLLHTKFTHHVHWAHNK